MASFIKILNSATAGVFKRILGEDGIWRLVNNPTVTGEKAIEQDQPLSNEELIEITNWRFETGKTGRKASISAVFGDPDFLPFSFLSRGITCGAAVCRLVRYYGCASELKQKRGEPHPEQDAGLQSLIDVLREQNQRRQDDSMAPFNDLNLAEILSIKPDDRYAFFQGHETAPLDALTIEKLRKLMPMPFGTGFLVGRNYLLTNHHVISSEEQVKEFVAQFGYEQDTFGRITLPVEYELDEQFFVTSSALDYTLVSLQPNPRIGEAGDNFGYLKIDVDPKIIAPPLTPEEAKERNIESQLSEEARERLNRPNLKGEIPGLPGDPVNIIQHPKGQPKEIVLSNNRVQEITQDFIRYEADVDFSSSGSPVLNQQWQLVGLHHASLADKDLNILGQEGIRISRIAEDLKNKPEQLRSAGYQLGDGIAVIRDCTDRWDSVELVIQTKVSEDVSASAIPVAEGINPKTIEVIQAHQRTQELAGQDFTSINQQAIKTELLTFAADCVSEAIKQLGAVDHPTATIDSIASSDDRIAWVQDHVDSLESYISELQPHITKLDQFIREYVNAPPTIQIGYMKKSLPKPV